MKISKLCKNKVFIGSVIIVILITIISIITGNIILSASLKKESVKSVKVTEKATTKSDKVASEEKIEETTETVKEVKEEEIVPIVYDNMTMEELSNKLDRVLTSDLTGKGNLFATYSMEKGVDPYMAVAIVLLETGCSWNCSNLVKQCNNVGGQKGSGCGSYQAFDTLDSGIMAFIDNIANNYYAYGLATPETINPKYAENPNWAVEVNTYIDKIRLS